MVGRGGYYNDNKLSNGVLALERAHQQNCVYR